MFRRRWRKSVEFSSESSAAGVELTSEQVFASLTHKLTDLIGVHGDWTLVRRTDEDTDRIFHTMITHQIAAELTQHMFEEHTRIQILVSHEANISRTPVPLIVCAEPPAPDAPQANAMPKLDERMLSAA